MPITVDLMLTLAGATETVEVAGNQDILETNPSAHTDVDQTLVDKLPVETTGGLNEVIGPDGFTGVDHLLRHLIAA